MNETPYLSSQEIRDIVTAIISVLGYNDLVQRSLMANLDDQYVSSITPTAMGSHMATLIYILDRMNKTPRLIDGTVPIQRFLENAAFLSGLDSRASPIRDGLANVTSRTAGFVYPAEDRFTSFDEKILFQNDMVPMEFMSKGLAASNAVAKLTVTRVEDGRPAFSSAGVLMRYVGTGWLLSPTLLMTNYHVIAARNSGETPPNATDLNAQAMSVEAEFDFNTDSINLASVVKTVKLVISDKHLDYAVLRLEETGRPGLVVSSDVRNLRPGSPVNIIQHPRGNHKHYAIRNNLVESVTDTQLRYFTDTMPGSSGSPVCDDEWRVQALHRGSRSVTNAKLHGRVTNYINYGSLMYAVLQHLSSNDPITLGEITTG
ncbi:trypsin-like peptidase domain-containing protein [Agrobacterium larrymoorei]|uniref:Serine protease n=1 Tax=Agrobacterium larrymoorei TaxID=160699 RepID=A0A4D7DX61_9HYPH|nr:trypsin-like peptidase domain-containing protein [Agrobacterium larrymoorei]QCJ00869.1 trypsin-like peptidase domain-containing protein [Agrobacterium larrymoorei]QYA10204.1 trypsin-like peptidase domain-containing protein [Agrobacterium larrymoorei]